MQTPHRVVIIGGGFGGLYATQALYRAPVEITLVDRRNFHLFQPLLYQVATGGLSPANIAAPLRHVLRRQRNVLVLLTEVSDFDLAGKTVRTTDGILPYDSLLVATGARHHYFGHPEWEQFAPGLKSIEDATRIRRRILEAFEDAEKTSDPERVRALLTFIVVGGGPTGVELAGAIAELANHTLRNNFRRIKPASSLILLVEATDRILSFYPPKLSEKAVKSLKELGVTVRTGTAVTNIQAGQVTLKTGDHSETIITPNILWGAGVQASPLMAVLAERSGAKTDRAGRMLINPDCTLPGYPDVFVIGDASCFLHQTGKPLPGVAPVAMQMGSYVADAIRRRAEGKSAPPAFHYRDKGSMATIGRSHAVADLGWTTLSGYFAWLAWLFIHLIYLIRFENRVMVLFQWAWNWFTRGRTARLITEVPPSPQETDRR